MILVEKSDSIFYYIIQDDEGKNLHYGKVEVGQTLGSGLDSLEKYYSESKFIERLEELGLHEEYLENNIEEYNGE